MDSTQNTLHEKAIAAENSPTLQSNGNDLKKETAQPLKIDGNVSANTTLEVGVSPKLSAGDGFTWGGYFQSIGILLLLLAALWGLVWLLRRYGRFNFIPKPGAFPHNGLRMEAQLPLGPRKGLTVVRFLDKRLLLGVTEHQITLLQEIEVNGGKGNVDFQSHLDDAVYADHEDGTHLHGKEYALRNTNDDIVATNSDKVHKNNE